VQGLIYNKILPYLEDRGWEFHFAGPSPELTSVLIEKLDYPHDRLHYAASISPSTRFSVFKNRCKESSFRYYWFAACQLIAKGLEKFLRHDSQAYLRSGLIKTVLAADKKWDFDLIAGKTPDFSILATSARICDNLQKPFVALVNDPHGHRDSTGFYPADLEQQKTLLDQSCGSIFMSPLTRERYIQAGLISRDKAYALTDSFPEPSELYLSGRSSLASRKITGMVGEVSTGRIRLHILHLGMLPPWRPIEPFLSAFEAFQEQRNTSIPTLELSIFGYLYPEAVERIKGSRTLSNATRVYRPVSYQESHWLAEDADLQLVVIGPRHVDNQPSKFFEYLGHGKPVLVIGPQGNPIETIINDLEIGLYADIENESSILSSLLEVANQHEFFQTAFERNHEALQAYSAHRVAEDWCRCLDSIEKVAKG
jgi:hypothetical protein